MLINRSSEPADDLHRGEIADRCQVGQIQIADPQLGVIQPVADPLGGRLTTIEVPNRQHHLGPGTGQRQRDLIAESGVGPGDHRPLAVLVGDPETAPPIHERSCIGMITSRTISMIAAATGTARMAPVTPSSAAPIRIATTTAPVEISTVRRITRGYSQ